MNNLIGGLFETQENANKAYEALQKTGFASEALNMFIRKPRSRTARKTNVPVQNVGVYALMGALIGGAIGGMVGFLVGSGIVPLPGVEPGIVEINSGFLMSSIVSGVVLAGLTGIILGVAAKLLGSREKAEVVTRQIDKSGVLVTVSVDGASAETRARNVMQEYGATEVGNPSEKWDLDAWTSTNDMNPTLRNLAESR